VQIADAVAVVAEPPPSLEALADRAAAEAQDALAPDEPPQADEGDEVHAVGEVVSGEAIVDDEAVRDDIETVSDDEEAVLDAAIGALDTDDGDYEDETELIPVVGEAGVDDAVELELVDAADDEMVDLDAEPSPLFEHTVDAGNQVLDVESTEVTELESASPAEVESDMMSEPDESDQSDGGGEGPEESEPIGFVDRFTAAIGDLPIRRG
jgi:hypothetical protein